MKKVKVEDSVGMVLGHDLTKIIPGQFKGAAFKKGHIVRVQDIEMLKSMGKDHLYILELGPHDIHEDEAAARMAEAAAGEGIILTEPSEGKVSFKAQYDGLFKVDKEALKAVNTVEHISMATLHDNTPVQGGQNVGGTRIIPLVTEKRHFETAAALLREKKGIIRVKPFKSMKIGVIITGSEVYYGRIQDKFAPVFREKMKHYGAELFEIHYAPDDTEIIKGHIAGLIDRGCEAVIAAGGMSVDPDDVTPEAIRCSGAEVVSYGTPVLPGAMFMMAYRGDVPVLGMPGCGMFHKTTVFDILFPRILAGETIKKEDIAELGAGGLCMHCDDCRYPRCGFGKV